MAPQNWPRLQATVGKTGWVCMQRRFLESVQCLGTGFTFQLIYIHANKEIDAAKLYGLKNPRTFHDLFYNSTVLTKKSQLPLGLWIITNLSLYTLPAVQQEKTFGLNRKLAQVSIAFSQYLLFEIALFGLFGHKMERKWQMPRLCQSWNFDETI